MIARLSNGGAQPTKPLAPQQSAAQTRRKRAKLIDLLLTTNWSKQSQQVANLMKLNKILLACDTNFLDEKSGESPLSLAISSPQIHQATISMHGQHQPLLAASCAQSASLFNLQFQSASLASSTGGMSQLMLQQTSKSDIIQSKAPLIERLLLLLVKSGALIDFPNSDGRTPLHMAAIKSNFWALKTLLDLGAATDYRDINGLTPLYYSILYKAALKVTQLLLIHSRNSSVDTSLVTPGTTGTSSSMSAVGITDQHGWQEVHQACKLGLDAHLEKLLYYGCDINAKISGSGNTPLHVAAINDQLNCAKVLLMRGADKTITNSSHQTAHQTAVIANNMEMAEFIAEHNDSKVVPFQERPTTNSTDHHNHRSSIRSSSLANSHSLASIASGQRFQQQQQQQRTIVEPLQRQQQLPQQQQHHHQKVMMKPLRLDVAHDGQQQHNSMMASAATTTTGTSICSGSSTSTSGASGSSQPQSLLSIGALQSTNSQQLNVQVNNISPCLSQRSCATSNTTSSSGVCCDGDGAISAEELNQRPQQLPAHLSESLSQHSSLTMLTIGNNNSRANNSKTNNNNSTFVPGACSFGSQHRLANDKMHESNSNSVGAAQHDAITDDGQVDEEDEEDLRSSGSSSNGLYSLMSEERPLFVGSIVEATSEYQSGDPNHLQLRRGDLIEVLEYTPEQIQSGQLPRLANKPMLFGRRLTDGLTGLFPSFCVNRTKHRQSTLRQKLPITNCLTKATTTTTDQVVPQQELSRLALNDTTRAQRIDGNSLPEPQSPGVQSNQSDQRISVQQQQQVSSQKISSECGDQPKVRFKEIQVTLTKTREGFGFVLRGAKVDPNTLAANEGQPNKFAIDERLMAANNLVSLQYLDEIENGGAAHRANLKRGDFLVGVNGQDVRLCSHEQVVGMIRQSGESVSLTLATPIGPELQAPCYMSKTLPKLKPEPPKRDPNTTLTRNRAQRVKSMYIQMHHQQQDQRRDQNEPFDSSRPLPMTPSAESLMSPTGSLNLMNRFMPNNLTHNFHSAQSLSSTATDSQSISSASTLSADQHLPDQQQSQQYYQSTSEQVTPTHSSSSTTTLTTVAAVKPKELSMKSASGSQYCISNAAASIAAVAPIVSAPVTNNQSTYQPAVIVTTKRNSQLTKACPTSPQKSVVSSSSTTAPEASTPTPPPPPPPLPDFSISPPAINRYNQRRISAPVDQSSPDILLDSRTLLKKRESLAVVGSQSSQDAPVPAQFGAVAAACAAAAHSRLQRQQAQQQQQVHSQQEPVQPPQPQHQQLPQLQQQPANLPQHQEHPQNHVAQNFSPSPEPPPPLPPHLPPPLPPQHQHQSQQDHLQAQRQHLSKGPRSHHQQEHHQQHHHHNHHHFHPTSHNHSHHNHRIDYQTLYEQEVTPVAAKNQTPEFIQQQQQQQQQLLLLHQQHLLKQQLRQQQLLQQQQQQLKLQQQVQMQQRLCLYGKHGLSMSATGTQDDNLTHNHNHLEHHHHRAYDTYDGHHHHHHHNDHQSASRCYDTSTTRSHHLCRRLNR